MQSIRLFSYTKNIDLHAVSANEAITSFMGYSKLLKLRRFLLTTFTLNTDSLKEAEASVETILARTMDILNPNKEAYRFHTLPAASSKSNIEIFYVYVTPSIATGESRHIQRIFQKTGIDVKSLEKGIVWELHVDSSGISRDQLQENVSEMLVSTTTRKKGMLSNPLFEKAVFLEPQRVLSFQN